MIDTNTIVINTTEQTTSTIELHSPLICGIKTTLVSDQYTELSKGPEFISSHFQTAEYCRPKVEVLKTETVSLLEIVSSRFKTMECCLPQTEILRIEDVSSLEVVFS